MPEKTYKTTIRHRRGYNFLFVYSPRTWNKIKVPVDVFEELTNVKIDPNKYRQFVELSTFDFRQILLWDSLDHTPKYVSKADRARYREEINKFERVIGRAHPAKAEYLNLIRLGEAFEKLKAEAAAAEIDRDNVGNEDLIPF